MTNIDNTQKYHLTQDGPRPCKAKKRCPKGGENRHFTNMKDAQAAYEKRMEEAAKSNLTMRQLSKSMALSRALRHDPTMIGEEYGENGTLTVEGVTRALRISREELEHIVKNDSKGRYSFEENGTLIRAVQGHTAKVKINFDEVTPPAQLYHGTAERFLPSIMKEGLKPMKRQYVHLSATVDNANIVASRRENPVLLTVNTAAMAEDGVKFYRAKNGVWLTAAVPPQYLTRTDN